MKDLDQCPCAGINLDKLVQPTILALLAREDLHGYGLVQKITEYPMFAGDKPDPTGVYRFLKILEQRGLVTAEWELADSGPPKKVYKITAEGIECLERWIVTLDEYRRSIDTLLSGARSTLEFFHHNDRKKR
ncbi:PadR family transcriptional regulator [Desulfomonile tiedjei]|uniref:Putative transcriptional regulator n=1 Tax=Desulfomonile tiedjei (strain ATCC 49306 / DSM 6799 / DCB-1) TaxID=706587 RepID=I4C212_DESTA|nr:PadR family transcriptional regulator [Desulfomonile tiedjei]AFM23603.1 putative transcriptional regulator [Desulfomonile tiedjei DSM 6799]